MDPGRSFRDVILCRLNDRDSECKQFNAVITSFNELAEYTKSLENTSLVHEILESRKRQSAQLEELQNQKNETDRVLTQTSKELVMQRRQYEELTVLHKHALVERRKLKDEIMTLSHQKVNAELALMEARSHIISVKDICAQNEGLRHEVHHQALTIAEFKESNQFMLEEFHSMQENYTTLEEKYKACLLKLENAVNMAKETQTEKETSEACTSTKDVEEEEEEKRDEILPKHRLRKTLSKRIHLESRLKRHLSAPVGYFHKWQQNRRDRKQSAPNPEHFDDSEFSMGNFDDIYSFMLGEKDASGNDILNQFGLRDVPSRFICSFKHHEGEVNDVQWCSSGDFFASGGSDGKVLLYETSYGGHKNKAVLNGCNGAVLRVDFNPKTNQVLASDSEHAIRIWGVDDHRLKHTLTGHTGKVLSAKFAGAGVISSSCDQTFKVWNLELRRCMKTVYLCSTALDIAPCRFSWTTLLSGHMDGKVRVWDLNSKKPIHTFDLSDKVTSLALSSDNSFLLCSTRNESLTLLDLRMNQVVQVYRADHYHSSNDYSRCTLSPGNGYCAAGSANGKIFIWNLKTTRLENVLSGPHKDRVTSVSWHPYNLGLLSADRMKTVCMWS